MKKHTYDNWWKGDVTLVHADKCWNEGDKPIIVDWADFSESDAGKIKDMQEKIFAYGWKTRLKAVCAQFTKRYEKSEMKLEYLTDEIQECRGVMFGATSNEEIVVFKHWESGFTRKELSDIRFYVKRIIKNGIEDSLGYIHSTNCKYQDKSPDCRMYARFVWEYFNWLKLFIKKEEKTDDTVANEIKEKPWFKVGLLFANGEIDTLKEKYTVNNSTNCAAITKELGQPQFSKYILATINNYTENNKNKNIYVNPDKLLKIYNHCIKNNIKMTESFLKRIQPT